MTHKRMNSNPQQSGMSLIEALVALAILTFASTATLLTYDDAWKFFKKGENAIEQQQAVRIAFDKLSLDFQVAGFNHNPDGDKTRPDEQIEAAFDTAIVLRADFDAPDPTRSTTPEQALAGGAFETVSVDNSEIVAYVLAKPDGSSSDVLTFGADVKDSPRDGSVETVSIPNVALVHDDPPYSLYRIALNNDATTWGSADFFVSTLLAENIRTFSLRYLDATGNPLNATYDLSKISDDIGGAETATAAAQRSAIRRIELDLVGLTRDPDMIWVDGQDSNPVTQSHRKFQLRGEISPRNMGMVGVPDLPVN